MSLVALVAVLLVVGVLLWGLDKVPAVDPTMKTFIRVIVIVVVCLWLLSLFFPEVGDIRIGRAR